MSSSCWASLRQHFVTEFYAAQVKRTISKEKAPVRKPGKVHAAMADHVSKNPFMAALELDQEACKAGPFADVPMCSLADYYRSLDVGPGGISAEKVAATLLAKAGMQALLPAVDAFAPEATKQGYNADDILANGFMGALFRKLLSPLKIFAITSALNEASSDMSAADLGHLAAAAQPSPVAAVDHFLAGEQPGLEPIWPEEFNLEDSFVLERDLPLIMAAWGVSRDDQSPTSKPEPGSEFLPDLCFSYGGLKTQETPWQVRSRHVPAPVPIPTHRTGS